MFVLNESGQVKGKMLQCQVKAPTQVYLDLCLGVGLNVMLFEM